MREEIAHTVATPGDDQRVERDVGPRLFEGLFGKLPKRAGWQPALPRVCRVTRSEGKTSAATAIHNFANHRSLITITGNYYPHGRGGGG